MIKTRGHWTPKINYAQLSNVVLEALANKQARLTGDELKFIRNKFEMTLSEFAERFYVTHPAVLKWERQKDKQTKMNWATEKDVRLFIYTKISKDNTLNKVYKQLSEEASDRKINTKVDIKKGHAVLAA